MEVLVKCRSCDYQGKVFSLRPGKKNSGKGDKGAAVTGVPCPKCGKHKLKRI